MADVPPKLNGQIVGQVYPTAPNADPSGMFRYTDSCGGGPADTLSEILTKNLNTNSIILLGEIHDNPFHHRYRGALLDTFFERHQQFSSAVPTKPMNPIVVEQMSTDQQPGIDSVPLGSAVVGDPNYGQRKKTSSQIELTAQLLTAIQWNQSGWAQYQYHPLFEAAVATNAPIYAGDVPKSVIRQAAKQGETAIAPEERTRLKLDVPLPANQQDAILTELEAAHCGMMPKTAFGGMAFAQRLRDATLADVALKAHAAHGSAIVMAGNGHVRGDRGIAWYIRQREPKIKVVTVALVEVEDGKTDPAAYVPRDPEGRPAVDYVVFTPKHVRPDPCDAFKKKP
jgi:uncharacterized iron-regulated protein